MNKEDIGQFAADALADAFNDEGIAYNGAAFAKISQMIQSWVDDGTFEDGSLDIGDYE